MDTSLIAELRELSSAEEILDHFHVDYEQSVLNINRLHILHRFHEYLANTPAPEPHQTHACARDLLTRAYKDFTRAPTQRQRSLALFRRGAAQRIPVNSLRGSRAGSCSCNEEVAL